MRTRALSLLVLCLLAFSAFAADPAKIPLYTESDILWMAGRSLNSSFDVAPLPTQGFGDRAFLVRADTPATRESLSVIRSAYEAGWPIVVVAPTPQTQSFLDDVTGGEVDLRNDLALRPTVLGEPRLEAFGFRRPAGAPAPDVAEFWVAFDANVGVPEEEKAEDDQLIAQIADWIRTKPEVVAAPAPSPAPRAPKGARPTALRSEANERPKIDDLTSAVVRKVSFAFDQGSVSTVLRSWAAYSSAQDEDWYIFELTTTSQPLNFATWSFRGMFDDWEKNADGCKGLLKTGCMRKQYASKVQIKLVPRTEGLELMFYGPDSDRAQDEYSYSSKFSLGGKVTAGYDDKGAKGGVELSGGAEFSRSTKVTIKDATLFGTSNPATDIAGWRFEMPPMRAVNDLTPYGGPSMNCDNLLQMPYPVQRGGMESRQYAIYRLPAQLRDRVKSIDLAVSLSLEESSSQLQNWTAGFCNLANCDCRPETWVHKNNELNDKIVTFPLAAHPVKK